MPTPQHRWHTLPEKCQTPQNALIRILTDAERNELHGKIHNYFAWLHKELELLETTPVGRHLVTKADFTTMGVLSR